MNRSVTALAAALVTALAISACGSSDPLAPPAPPAGGDTVTVGSADFPESRVLAEIYAQALEAKGVKVARNLGLGNRELYLQALNRGEIDLVPEYTGNLLTVGFDPQATVTSSEDVYAALVKALPPTLTVLDMASAQDKDAVVLSRETATRLNARSIADLGPNCGQLVFGGPAEFRDRPYGLAGLERNYGCVFKEFRPLDTGTLTVSALKDGTVQAADIFTTSSAIAANDFVVLEDPKNNFVAQNVVPLITTSKATDPVRQTLNAVSAALTTEDLLALNVELDSPAAPNPDVVAKEWLASKRLL